MVNSIYHLKGQNLEQSFESMVVAMEVEILVDEVRQPPGCEEAQYRCRGKSNPCDV